MAQNAADAEPRDPAGGPRPQDAQDLVLLLRHKPIPYGAAERAAGLSKQGTWRRRTPVIAVLPVLSCRLAKRFRGRGFGLKSAHRWVMAWGNKQ